MNMNLIINKSSIITLGLLIFLSINARTQPLGKHMLNAGASVGFLQKETNFSYQYSPLEFLGGEDKNVLNQVFFGIEAGKTKLKERYFESSSSLFPLANQTYANGNHYSLLITKIAHKPSTNKNKPASYKYLSLKFTLHKFRNVRSYEYDTYNEDDDLDSDEPDVTITDAGCKSFDIEMRFGKHLRLNQSNHLRFEFYTGIRFGSTYGTRNWEWMDHSKGKMVKEIHRFERNLNPFILGLSLSYQVNLGRKKLSE